MTGILLLSWFPKFTDHCVNTPTAWLRTAGVAFVFGGWMAAHEADCGCSAMTDRNMEGLCQVYAKFAKFMNNEVTILTGLMSLSLLWEIIWDLARVTIMAS